MFGALFAPFFKCHELLDAHVYKNYNFLLSFHFTARERDAMDAVHSYSNRLRFRKRDKMMFYGRRMLRKVKTLSGQAYNGQGRKRRAVMRFAKRILYLRRDDTLPMQLKTVEPPLEYLEETSDGFDKVPPDAFCMLQGIRIFGHFEKPIFLRLCKFTEIITLNTNDLLFKIGKRAPRDSFKRGKN